MYKFKYKQYTETQVGIEPVTHATESRATTNYEKGLVECVLFADKRFRFAVFDVLHYPISLIVCQRFVELKKT